MFQGRNRGRNRKGIGQSRVQQSFEECSNHNEIDMSVATMVAAASGLRIRAPIVCGSSSNLPHATSLSHARRRSTNFDSTLSQSEARRGL
eukprot:5833375-Pleurochrysis_carterae.AAC.1